MKKLLSVLALAASLSASADEGMWTLYNLPPQVYAMMQQEGFQLPYNALYNDSDAIMHSVVDFSDYCSGVVVSPDGLVFTNHHCGFEAIRSHSTVDHDYMIDGFVAHSYDEELPNENIFVSFMVSQQDVTAKMRSRGIDTLDSYRQDSLIEVVREEMRDSVRRIDSLYTVEILPFYEGNAYYASVYMAFPDVRLVFAPPKSMGKFGGETDNWMWPRQTCDFSVFRIYCDPKTGRPAPYSKDNVPYHPKTWARVSLDGYKDGDFAMTMGYPGSTERYLSSYGIREMRDAGNTPRIQVRGIKQDIMLRHMKADEAVRIKYDSKFVESSNYWKNSIGMNKCIDSIGIIAQKAAYENRIRHYQDSTGYLRGELDFNKMKQCYDRRFEDVRALTYFGETFYRTSELCSRIFRMPNLKRQGPADKPEAQYVVFDDNSSEWDEATDKEVLAALMDNYRHQVAAKYLPSFYREVDEKFGGNCSSYVDNLYKKSLLMKSGKRIYPDGKQADRDPGLAFGASLKAMLDSLRQAVDSIRQATDVQEMLLCRAKLRMEEDMPHYSDANFTMRLSYGQVGGYLLGGSPSGYYTAPASILAKMKRGDQGVDDYRVQPVMKELMSQQSFGRYQDQTTGDLHLCFLTNNDITGGNSGSPVFDGKGQLIGLAFDGNWDSLASDINFDKRLSRTISVDIRFVLYMMDRWGHADRLLREIGTSR
jgi:hypothetical protein